MKNHVWHAANLQSINSVQHAFFGRQGGVSKGAYSSLNISMNVGDSLDFVAKNRRRVCKWLQSEGPLYLPKQVHGDRIVRVRADTNQAVLEQLEADALFTTDRGVLIGVQTADCAPLLLSDQGWQAVMAVHLGWRGVASHLTQKAIAYFCEAAHVPTGAIVAAIGPCIGFSSFEVRGEVVQALMKQVISDKIVKPIDDVHSLVDLSGWIERILTQCGVKNVVRIDMCTMQNEREFFSHRRDKGVTGRQVSVIKLANPT